MTKEPAPRVSVVIPTHNRREFVLRAVASVRAQTVTDIEIIVVDDASADGTEETLAGLGEPRLQVIRHAVNRGAPAARNTGIASARGKYIAFLDDDDWWLERKLELQLAALQGYDAVLCGFRIAGRARPVVSGIKEVSIRQLRKGNRFGGSGLLISSSGAKALRFDESLPNAQDWDFLVRVVTDYRVGYVPQALFVVDDGPHRRITNSSRGDSFEELEMRGLASLKHAELLGPYWLHYRLVSGLLAYIGSREKKLQHLRKVGRKYGWVTLAHVLLDKTGRGLAKALGGAGTW